MRVQFLSFMFLFRPIFVLLLSLTAVAAQTPKPELISPQVKNAVEKAVAWLVKQQKPAGFIVDEKTDAKPKRGDLPAQSAAITSLALMGLASVGHMPNDPTPEGQACGRALKYVVDGVEPDENGYLARSDRSRMYGHGIISLMMAEMIGHAPDEATDKRLRSQLKGAIQLIIRSQQVPKTEANRGGWRYEPGSTDSDISVSVWQVMALRAAKDAGFDVPKEYIDNAVAYIKRSYAVERDARGVPKSDSAPFTYTVYDNRKTFSTTAAGLLSLQVCGQYDAPEVHGSANFLLKTTPEITEPWFFYGCYYYAQGMYQKGGDHAATARQKTEQTLIAAQANDGSWHPRNGNEKSQGAVYATSLALLSLSVHHHFLPIYQK